MPLPLKEKNIGENPIWTAILIDTVSRSQFMQPELTPDQRESLNFLQLSGFKLIQRQRSQKFSIVSTKKTKGGRAGGSMSFNPDEVKHILNLAQHPLIVYGV